MIRDFDVYPLKITRRKRISFRLNEGSLNHKINHEITLEKKLQVCKKIQLSASFDCSLLRFKHCVGLECNTKFPVAYL